MAASPSRALDDGPDRVARAFLVAACVLASVRFLGLGQWSLWLDEAYTLADSRHGESYLNPLGYHLFRFVYGLADARPDEFLLRLPAAVLGWLCVPATAWALAPFVGRRASVVAALLVALSPWHVYWSQTARFYTLAQLLGLVGLRWSYLGLALASVRGVLLGVAAFATAAITHPSAAILAASALGVPWLVRWCGGWPGGRGAIDQARAAWRTLGVLVLIAAALGSVWALVVWEKWEQRQGSGDPLHLVLSTGYYVTPAVGLGVLCGVVSILRRRASEARLLLSVLVGGLGVALAASFLARVSAQYVFVFYPLVLGVAARPLHEESALWRTPLRAAGFAAVLALPLVAETAVYFTLRNGDRPMWREAYRYVFDHRDHTDLVLGIEAPVGEFYWNRASDDLRHLTQLTYLDEFRAHVPVEWSRYGRPMWLIVNEEQLEDWPGAKRDAIRRFLHEECRREAHFPIPLSPRDLDVSVYTYGRRVP